MRVVFSGGGGQFTGKFMGNTFLIKTLLTLMKALLKNRLWHRCFPVNFTKFLRTSFLTERLRWLLLVSSLDTILIEFWQNSKYFNISVMLELFQWNVFFSETVKPVAAQETWKNVKEILLVHSCTVAHLS